MKRAEALADQQAPHSRVDDLEHILSLAKRARDLSTGPQWKTAADKAVEDHGEACEQLWDALYRLLDERANEGNPVAPAAAFIALNERKALRKELLLAIKTELPGLIDQVLEGVLL